MKILRMILCFLLLLATANWVILEDLPERPYPQMPASLARATVGLPANFDWRDTGFVTPVKNQGSCGSCWAFASLAPLEFRLAQMGKTATDLSEQIVLNYSRAGDCSGGYMSTTAIFLAQMGDTVDSCLPYNGGYQENQGACQDWDKNAYRYDSWDYIYPVPDVDTIKTTVYERGPVAAVFALFSDFRSWGSWPDGIYKHDPNNTNFEGYHAVNVIGWDDGDGDSEGYLICKNSWGVGWGEGGYFKVAYSEVGSPTTNFAYQVYYYGDAFFAYPVKAEIETQNDPEGFVPYTVDLSGLLSTGTIDSLLWDFGDGETSTEASVTHTFESPNDYEVKLLVTNNIDGSSETSMTFHPQPPPDPLVQDDSKDDDGARGGCFFSTAKDNN